MAGTNCSNFLLWFQYSQLALDMSNKVFAAVAALSMIAIAIGACGQPATSPARENLGGQI